MRRTSPPAVGGERVEIPLGHQLAATLEAAIRDRHIPPGARLPPTRDLARHLGLDRGSVDRAYARLRRRGCALGRVGGVLRARPLAVARALPVRESRTTAPADREPRARELARRAVDRTLAEGRESGISRHLLRDALAAAARGDGRPAESAGHVALYEPRPGLRRALVAELSGRLRIPVAGPSPGRARSAATVLHRAEIRPSRGSPLAGASEWVRFTLAGGTRERGLARRKAPFGRVVLLSVSRTVRRFAAELAARDVDRPMRFLALDPGAGSEVVRAVADARLVLHDLASTRYVPPTTARVEPIHLLPAYEVASLRGYLDVGER